MIELGIFHNGASGLPVKITKDGVAVNDGDLRATQEAAARTQVDQIRQGVLADELGYHYFFLTEHHFQPEGAEFSPNPLNTQMAIAALRSTAVAALASPKPRCCWRRSRRPARR